MSCFWTRNSAKRSVSSMFARSNLAYELCGKSGFLERQLSHKTKNSSSEITLQSYASSSISLVSRKVFSSFRGRFRKGCRREKRSLLKLAGTTAPSYPGSPVSRRRRRPKNIWFLSSLMSIFQRQTPPRNDIQLKY